MKHFSTKFWFVAFCIIVISNACSKDAFTLDAVPENSISENGFYTTRIAVSGVSVDVSSLTKAVGGEGRPTLYAFEVDTLHIVPAYDLFGKECKDTTYHHYAEGIFESLNNINIILQEGRIYRWRCTVVSDREDAIYRGVDGRTVYDPFVATYSSVYKSSAITNEFRYDSEKTLDLANNSNTICVGNGERLRNARVDRWYGECTDGEVRTSASAAPVINVSRRNFGLHFSIASPREGTLRVYQETGFPKYSYTLTYGDSSIEEEYLYALDLMNEFSTIYLKVEWTREDGTVVDLSPAKFRAYNNTMTTISVDINSRIGGQGITVEDGGDDMTNQNVDVH